MAAKHYITHDNLLERVIYNPATGIFSWIKIPSNRRSKPNIIGSDDMYGYKTVRLDGISYKLHRLAWFYFYKTWPLGDIDHINGCRSDNRIENLRDVTRKINLENRTVLTNNKSTGFYGAYYDKRKNKFYACISQNNKKIHLGFFDSAEDANKAYIEAKKRMHIGYIY